MENQFFERPILNSPYEYPSRHWELDKSGQPTQQILGSRRTADFVTPIPKPRKQKGQAEQPDLVFNEGRGLSSEAQGYDHTAIINAVRQQVDRWRLIPDPGQWHITPDGYDDPLNLIAEIKGYRREDAIEKKATMDTYWIPGVNHLGSHGRWAFAEFTDVYAMQEDFAKKIEAEFDRMIGSVMEGTAIGA